MSKAEIKAAHAALTALGAPEDGTLAERINQLGEELAATNALNRNLLDPDFTFAGDRMNVLDARGIVGIFVESFDEAMQKGGAENFMTFDVVRGNQLAYVVTIQKATGKTQVEKYTEVARELRELQILHCEACAKADAVDGVSRCAKHAQPIAPLPEDVAEPRAPQPRDHLVVDLKESSLRCLHCGREVALPRPVPASILKAMQEAFTARHERCPAPKKTPTATR